MRSNFRIMLCNTNKNFVKLAQFKMLIDTSDKISINEIKTFLFNDFDVNYALSIDNQVECDKYLGYTALHFAVTMYAQNRFLTIKYLLDFGAKLSCQNHEGFTPLRLAFEIYNKDMKYGPNITLMNQLLKALLQSCDTTNPRCNNGITHLHIACSLNNLKVVEFYLKAGVSVNEAINNDSSIYPGYTCLHLAVKNESKEIVKMLLKHGADCTTLCAFGFSPLQLLIKDHINTSSVKSSYINENLSVANEEVMDILLQFNRDNIDLINQTGLSQFHIYCTKQNCQRKDLEKFLKDGVNINETVSLDSPLWPGYTSLHFAILCNLQTAMFLLENGADLMAKYINDITYLDLCLKKYKIDDVIKLLKSQDKFTSIKLSNNQNLVNVIPFYETSYKLYLYLKNNTDINFIIPLDSPLWPGYTSLHLAVIFSSSITINKVKYCLTKNPYLMMVKDANNLTALHLAYYKQKCSSVDTILNMNESISIKSNPVDNKKLSHFHIACLSNNLNIVKKFLIESKVDLNIPIQNDLPEFHKKNGITICDFKAGSTLLHIGVGIKSKSLIELLLEHNADSSLLDSNGLSWIHWTFTKCRFEMFKTILWKKDQTLKLNLVAPGGLSYLHIACYTGSLKAVESFLPTTNNINEPINKDVLRFIEDLPESVCLGDTPLHLAVKADSIEIVKLLLENGADVLAKNKKGLNSLHVALLMLSNKTIIKYLSSKFYKNGKWTDETGLTRLHIACALKDLLLMKYLLHYRENIHSTINSNSPVWPDETPLSILIKNKNLAMSDNAVKLLLKHYLKNIENSINCNYNLRAKRRKKSSLEIQNLFINKERLSVFYVSCMGNDPSIVEQFLKFGTILNAPRDLFAHCYAGYTPLHFAVEFGSKSVIEMLLKYKANINLENSKGLNPFLLAVKIRLDAVSIFLRYCEIDFTKKDAYDRSVMQLLMYNFENYKDEFQDNILNILKFGGAKNIDFSTTAHFIKKSIKYFSVSAFKSAVELLPEINFWDNKGANIIHQLVIAYPSIQINSQILAKKIEILINNGCELDHQDKYGKTPLHYSSMRTSKEMTEALLLLGADVNILDLDVETPYSSVSSKSIHMDCYGILHRHVCKLIAARSYLHPLNEVCYRSKQEPQSYRKIYLKELKNINKTVYKTISFRDILTENIVMKFPSMSFGQRHFILNYLKSDSVHEQFPLWSALLKLQQRKIMKRISLSKLAITAMDKLFNYRIPKLCLEIVTKNLNDQDWNNLIRTQN